jgi:hypothetical protein
MESVETLPGVWEHTCKNNPRVKRTGTTKRYVKLCDMGCMNAAIAECESSEPRQCQPGCQLTRLLARLSIEKQGGCGCEDYARQMDAWGVDGCRERVGEIVDHLREQAAERNMPFNRRAATWLVKLAIKLAEQQREPNAFERVVLAGMGAVTNGPLSRA